MKAICAAIDVRGNFLHFDYFKTVEQWNAVQINVQNMQPKLIIFKREVEAKINDYFAKLQIDPNKWDEVHNKFFAALNSITTKHCDETLSEFDKQAASQLDSAIKEEGRNTLRNMFAAEKLNLESKWLQRERE